MGKCPFRSHTLEPKYDPGSTCWPKCIPCPVRWELLPRKDPRLRELHLPSLEPSGRCSGYGPEAPWHELSVTPAHFLEGTCGNADLSGQLCSHLSGKVPVGYPRLEAGTAQVWPQQEDWMRSIMREGDGKLTRVLRGSRLAPSPSSASRSPPAPQCACCTVGSLKSPPLSLCVFGPSYLYKDTHA